LGYSAFRRILPDFRSTPLTGEAHPFAADAKQIKSGPLGRAGYNQKA